VDGEGSERGNSFPPAMTDWHRYLGAAGENRAPDRLITRACSLAFLFVLAGGIYLRWLRFRHTGEAGGFCRQTVSGLASTGCIFPVCTGFALAIRHFFASRRRRRRPAIDEAEVPSRKAAQGLPYCDKVAKSNWNCSDCRRLKSLLLMILESHSDRIFLLQT